MWSWGRGRIWSRMVGGAGEEVQGGEGAQVGTRCGQLRWQSGHWLGGVGALGDRRRGALSVAPPLIQAGVPALDAPWPQVGAGLSPGP